MSAAPREPHPRPKATQTFWPASRPAPPPASQIRPPIEQQDEEHPAPATEEPGYGHGV